MVKITYINTIETLNTYDCCKYFNFNIVEIYYINAMSYFKDYDHIQKDYKFYCNELGYFKLYHRNYDYSDYFTYFMDMLDD